ncbi:hypothetical protein [Pseudopedobacter beijingensis]|uniref:Uncharacterized protein n=1 Tax=Pseudopedobacter beijingensis TaxID=1207056 RepID=A0ABW4IA82_9SPHI
MKFERSLFQKGSFKDADIQIEYWKSKSYSERLEAAMEMTKLAFGLVGREFPKMEKKLFSINSRDGKHIQ